MDRATYDNYARLFNARDYDGVLDHFADRFELVFAQYVFTTKDQVRKFYAFLHANVDEQVIVRKYVSDATMIAMEADIRLEGKVDMTPAMLAEQALDRIMPIAKGQVITIPQFIHYHLENGKIVKALCALYEPPVA